MCWGRRNFMNDVYLHFHFMASPSFLLSTPLPSSFLSLSLSLSDSSQLLLFRIHNALVFLPFVFVVDEIEIWEEMRMVSMKLSNGENFFLFGLKLWFLMYFVFGENSTFPAFMHGILSTSLLFYSNWVKIDTICIEIGRPSYFFTQNKSILVQIVSSYNDA
jgi:hypothetical protein